MKISVAGIFLTLSISSSMFAADFDIGLSGTEKGVDSFSFSIGDYYRVPQREVVIATEELSASDISVAYFLAEKVRRSPKYIAKLRMAGSSWWDISINLGLNPEVIYVVETDKRYGPPYGRAYGHKKSRKKLYLDDDAIAELVNVRFLSSYHRVSIDEVIERRRAGEDFRNIDRGYHETKSKNKHKAEYREDKKKNKSEKREDGRGKNRD